MPQPSDQTFANHTRFQPPFHYLIVPVVFLNLCFAISNLWSAPSWQSANSLLLAVGLFAMAALTRLNALKVQDRVIRLEEHLRFDRVLPAELAARAKKGLTEGQIVALRFAPDGELAELVEKALGGSLAAPKDIKAAIKSWRGDYFRV